LVLVEENEKMKYLDKNLAKKKRKPSNSAHII